jgi:opacity protein-like surface antigen
MKMFALTATLCLFAAPSSYAQTGRAYVSASGGFAVGPDGSSGDVLGEAGVRIAPGLFVFGDVGQLHNLEPSALQPAVDSTTAFTSATGLAVIGTARVPAWYSLGGLRYQVPMRSRLSPYVFGGAGVARLTPRAQFTYSSGLLPGATPSIGDDVTAQLTTLGDFTAPAATNNFTIALGGGVELPLAAHLTANVGYRYTRVAAETPLNAQGMTFGFGYRF